MLPGEGAGEKPRKELPLPILALFPGPWSSSFPTRLRGEELELTGMWKSSCSVPKREKSVRNFGVGKSEMVECG